MSSPEPPIHGRDGGVDCRPRHVVEASEDGGIPLPAQDAFPALTRSCLPSRQPKFPLGVLQGLAQAPVPSLPPPYLVPLGFLPAWWWLSAPEVSVLGEPSGSYVVLSDQPWKSHSITSAALVWLKRSRKPAHIQGEEIQFPTLDSKGVKLTL